MSFSAIETNTGDPTLETFKQGLQAEWDRCGADLLRSNAEYGDPEDGGGEGFNDYDEPLGTMTRNEVFEVCADLYVGSLFGDEGKELRELWLCMSDEDRRTLKHSAFPCELYGY